MSAHAASLSQGARACAVRARLIASYFPGSKTAESLAHHSENVGIQFYALQQDYIGRKKFALHLSLEPLAGGRGGESRCFPRTMSPAQPIEQFGAHPTEPVHRATTSLKQQPT
jgi:hypothetical protein